MDTVRLKNGTEEAKGLVDVTVLSLRELCASNPMAFYDMVMVCRDDTYNPWGANAKHLRNLGLLEPMGGVHGSIRNIVMSAVTGDGLDMKIGSPLADAPTPAPATEAGA